MTDQLYHYSIILRVPKPPTKKLQKAHSEDQVFLDKELRAATYGKHLMIPTMDLGEQVIAKAQSIIERRYGPEAEMIVAYGWDHVDQNTTEKFAAHKKVVNDFLSDTGSLDGSNDDKAPTEAQAE
jgi:hypothetical protein